LLEVVLSFDNLFVFHMIIKSFKVPFDQVHKALFYGILFAIISRLFLLAGMGMIMHSIHAIHVFVGVFLIYSGVQALQDEDSASSPGGLSLDNAWCKALGRRQLHYYDPDGKIAVYDKDGYLCITMLLPAILTLEAADVLFATDSVSAKVAQMSSVQAAFSSSAFAMFGLRATYFLLCDLMEYFDHLKYGICFILVVIGANLILSDIREVPFVRSHVQEEVCAVVVIVFVVSIVSSMANAWWEERQRTANIAQTIQDLSSVRGSASASQQRRDSRRLSVRTQRLADLQDAAVSPVRA
jgi:tellurite resistance protein TerC